MGNKHTPGPWKVTGARKLFIMPLHQEIAYNWENSCDECNHCNVKKVTDITVGSQIYTPRRLKEAQANAQLIAAAPELLQAARCALADLEGLQAEGVFYYDGEGEKPPQVETIEELQYIITKAAE